MQGRLHKTPDPPGMRNPRPRTAGKGTQPEIEEGTRMRAFMDSDFLLTTETAKKLYHRYAEVTPILDYHCHLDPRDIAEDRHFDNIAQVWLGGDHYKWRQMRSNGVPERYITGDAPDREKFQMWAETLERAIGNPLYHWSHLELQRYFGYHGALNGDTAQEVWDTCNAVLQRPETSARSFIRQSHVTLICTTDDPADSLEWHEKIAQDPTFEVQVLPAWRPDRAVAIEKENWPEYIGTLSRAAEMPIDSFAALVQALSKRADFFQAHGCKTCDHGLAYVMYAPADDGTVEGIFARRMAGEAISPLEEKQFKTALLLALGRIYHRLDWVMQLHYGVKRDLNRRIFQSYGPDAGTDSIGSAAPVDELADFLDALDRTDELPKTVLYSLNPTDNAAIGTVIGCFQSAPARGKIQQGSAWWFNDHKTGMTEQMTSLANLGILGNFIGMLTDSRSFLSYTRHEYFRRNLCQLIGSWVENGEYPDDEARLGGLIQDICYRNAVRYFGFDLEIQP